MSRILFFMVVGSFVTLAANAKSYTLVGKCTGYKLEVGEGILKVMQDFQSNEALLVVDQLSGRIYSETASVAKSEETDSQIKITVDADTLQSGSEITLIQGKNIPTALLKTGKISQQLLCSYGFNNL